MSLTVPNAFVIAVSGISGAGKSSVIQRTVELLGGASTLQFDDYASVSTYPPDLRDWMERGANVDEWKTPQLADDLRQLRAGEAVTLPSGRRIVEPAAFIVIEEPFGKLRSEMRDLIDLAAHVDVPADVLLARRLLRRLEEERHLFGDGLLDQLHRDLRQHLAAGRELDALGSAAARDAADLVLDGTGTVDEIAQTLVAEIRKRISK